MLVRYNIPHNFTTKQCIVKLTYNNKEMENSCKIGGLTGNVIKETTNSIENPLK